MKEIKNKEKEEELARKKKIGSDLASYYDKKIIMIESDKYK